MQIKIKTFIQSIFIILLLFSFSACHNLFKKDNEPEPIYLVSYEMIKAYLPVLVEGLFNEFENEYPDMNEIRDRVKHGIIIYKISYKTTFEGRSTVASGLVAVPSGEGPFPVISYQNGTNTLHSNAPSVNPDSEVYVLLESIASTGFVISIPDYLGFGSSDNIFHPYMHKESTVQTVLDMLRALKELADLRNFSLNNDLYLTGYSQGGWATMQVQKAIETNHSNEFNLKASAPAAGPYDLSFINEYILNRETYPMPYFAGYLFNSYMNLEGMTTPIDSVFNAPYASIIPALFDGSKTGSEINELLTTSVAGLFTGNFRQNYATGTAFISFIQAIEANSIEAWNTLTPTRIIHGTSDTFIPFQVSQNIFNDFQASGANNVELIPLPDLDHSEGIIPAGLFTIKWFLELTE